MALRLRRYNITWIAHKNERRKKGRNEKLIELNSKIFYGS